MWETIKTMAILFLVFSYICSGLKLKMNTPEACSNFLYFVCFLNRKDMIRQMMTRIFRCIEPELNNLIALGDKIDSFNSLYMLVKMSHHVWTAQNVDPASFLSTTLGNVLVTVKRNFDKCIVSFFKKLRILIISKNREVYLNQGIYSFPLGELLFTSPKSLSRVWATIFMNRGSWVVLC